MATEMQKDVIVIGAGASGMLCATEAGKRGRTVLLLDHGQQVGRKIAVSGGGRCNATNLFVAADRYFSRNPHFCRSALSRYTPQHFLELAARSGLRFAEEEEGKIFCRDGSRAIVAMLRKECSSANVLLRTGCRVTHVGKDTLFRVRTDQGEFSSLALVVATGGLSYRALGASDLGYRIARSFGIGVTDLRPGLVPLRLAEKETREFSPLSGVSLDVGADCGGRKFRGSLLFTHRGMSGPVVLQASNCWQQGEPLRISLLPGQDALEFLKLHRNRKIGMKTLLSTVFPRRFAEAWCSRTGSKPLNQYNEKDLRKIAEGLINWNIMPAGTEGYDRAEVTVGGVDTDALSSKTMEAKCVPGLYFTGEVIDVTGQLGGYNLHWAWASGYAAGQYA